MPSELEPLYVALVLGVLVEDPGVTGQREALARFGQLLREQPGVAGVVGPGLLPPQLDAQGIVLSRTGNAARYLLVLDDPPLGAEAMDTVAALRERAPGLAGQAGLPSVRLGLAGDTALAEEVVLATTTTCSASPSRRWPRTS